MQINFRGPITFATAIAATAYFGAAGQTTAAPSEVIGKASTINGSVSGRVSGKTRKLSKGNPVYLKERITVRSKSSGEFILRDNSRIAVGPGATIILDKFLVSSGVSANNVTLNLVRGALRFKSGRSGSKAYRIKTPTASLGVRGTVFHVHTKNSLTTVLLVRGGLDVCGKRGCKKLNRGCSWATIDRNGRIKTGASIRGAKPARVNNAVAFPLAMKAGLFSRNGASCFGGSLINETNRPAAQTVSLPGDPTTPEVPDDTGNPGNDKGVGKSGENPGGGGFGSGDVGKSQ
jgi:hypothetical protein